jgi:L-amino acid N-acyltransferase YncA
MKELIFRKANSKDIKVIETIHNSNVRNQDLLSDRGFLLAKTTESEILQKISRSTQYFVATTVNDKVLGFVTISKPKISKDFLNQIIWKSNSYKDKIINDKHLYLQTSATHPEYGGRGVARFLYESLYKKFPDSYISAFIVTKPICNNRSLAFHSKQGFQPIGTLQAEQFLDLQNYESVLMFKET